MKKDKVKLIHILAFFVISFLFGCVSGNGFFGCYKNSNINIKIELEENLFIFQCDNDIRHRWESPRLEEKNGVLYVYNNENDKEYCIIERFSDGRFSLTEETGSRYDINCNLAKEK